jgi:PAS domain S-box-containing protein
MTLPAQPDSAAIAGLLQATARSVVVCDAFSRIVWVNPGFTRLTGYTPSEAVGRNPGKLLQGSRTDRATVARLHEALTAGRAMQCEILNYRKDGSYYWNDLEIIPLRDTAGILTGYISLQEEITLDRQRIAALARHAPGLLCQFHSTPGQPPRLHAFDDVQAQRIYGFTAEQLDRDFTPCLERIPADERTALLAAIEQSAKRLTAFACEITYAHPDGSLRRQLVRSSPEAKADGSTLWHGYVDDITDQHQQRERLSRLEAQVPGMMYQFELDTDGKGSRKYNLSHPSSRPYCPYHRQRGRHLSLS